MSTDIYADREVSAADQAWWAMDVPCTMDDGNCPRPASWAVVPPCAHRRTWCAEHRRAFLADPVKHCMCMQCSAVFMERDITWTRL